MPFVLINHVLKKNNMYDEKLENLIEMALIDGVLTEKKKQILFKKADELGVDLDEFEIVLDAKVFEKQNQQNQGVLTKEMSTPFQSSYQEIKTSSIQLLIKTLDEYENNRMHDFREEVGWMKNNQKKSSFKKQLKISCKITESFIPKEDLIMELVDDNKELSLDEKIENAERKEKYKIIRKKKSFPIFWFQQIKRMCRDFYLWLLSKLKMK